MTEFTNNNDARSKIKAIETEYKGYRFRSRLEARWAVFFDALGIKWEYEIEGYNIFGEGYLPDFWLPGFCCFAEIKPDPQPEDTLYHNFTIVVNKAIILLCGYPWEYTGTFYGFDSCDSGGGTYSSECVVMSPMALVIHEERSDRSILVSEWISNPDVVESYNYNGSEPWSWDWEECKNFSKFRTKDAAAKSKRSRFEHGEHP